MCLAVPGKLIRIEGEEAMFRTGVVDFGGVRREVSLACVPEAQLDDYVLVHVGLAISIIDEREARRIFEYLAEMDELEGLQP